MIRTRVALLTQRNWKMLWKNRSHRYSKTRMIMILAKWWVRLITTKTIILSTQSSSLPHLIPKYWKMKMYCKVCSINLTLTMMARSISRNWSKLSQSSAKTLLSKKLRPFSNSTMLTTLVIFPWMNSNKCSLKCEICLHDQLITLVLITN